MTQSSNYRIWTAAVLVALLASAPAMAFDTLLVGVRDGDDPKIVIVDTFSGTSSKWNKDAGAIPQPGAIDVDIASGRVYVTSATSGGGIRVYDLAGNLQDTCCGGGWYPTGVFRDGSHIYSTQQDANRDIMRWDATSPFADAPSSGETGTNFTQAGSKLSNGRSIFRNAAGDITAVDLGGGARAAGLWSFDADGNADASPFITPATGRIDSASIQGGTIYALNSQSTKIQSYNGANGSFLSEIDAVAGNQLARDIFTGNFFISGGVSCNCVRIVGSDGLPAGIGTVNGVGEFPNAIDVIPEPATLALLAIGGGILLIRRRRA